LTHAPRPFELLLSIVLGFSASPTVTFLGTGLLLFGKSSAAESATVDTKQSKAAATATWRAMVTNTT
jgi:hypothetical protein